MDGQEIELGMQIPYVPAAKLYAQSWKWSGVSTTKGKSYSLELNEMVGPGIRLEAGVKDYDGITKDENFVNISYNINLGNAGTVASSVSIFSARMFEKTSMRSKLLEEVRRSNEIVYETNLAQQQGEFKMKYSGYFLLPLMIFSSDYAAAGVLNGTADNGTACSSSSPMMAADALQSNA